MESIYNLIQKPKKEDPPKLMYRSKYDPKAPLTGSTFGLHGTTVTNGKGINELKKTCVVSSTFGPRPNANTLNPSNFLKKGTRAAPKTGAKTCIFNRRKSLEYTNQKPPVPSRDEKPVLGLKTNHNFITANALDVILSSVSNDKKDEENFMKKETFGKIPYYLHKIREEVCREKKFIDDLVKQKMDENRNPATEHTRMDEDERKELIQMLQKKWTAVNRNYQKICHRVTMETPGDIRRKETQEAELQQLEDDIEKLSRPGPIMIRRD